MVAESLQAFEETRHGGAEAALAGGPTRCSPSPKFPPGTTYKSKTTEGQAKVLNQL